jgi:hypothetical protein
MNNLSGGLVRVGNKNFLGIKWRGHYFRIVEAKALKVVMNIGLLRDVDAIGVADNIYSNKSCKQTIVSAVELALYHLSKWFDRVKRGRQDEDIINIDKNNNKDIIKDSNKD